MRSHTARIAALPLVLAVALALACADPSKAPAEAALQAADTAVAALGDVGAKFAPQEVAELQKAVADARALAARKDYRGALAAAGAIPARAQAAVAAATERRDAVIRTWGELAAAVPQMAAALKSRVEALSQSKRLPEGLQQGALDQARAGAAELEAGFGAALASYNAGEFEAAITRAASLKARGQELLDAVGRPQDPAQPR